MVEPVLMWLGFGLCHQLPERSLFGGPYQVPVCARDTGIYLGFLASFALVALLARGRRPSSGPPVWVTVLAIGFVVLMGFDGVSSYAGWRATTNELRLITGLLAGYALGLFILPLLNAQLWRVQDPGRPLDKPWKVLVWVATIPLVYAVTWWVLPTLGIWFPILVTLAFIATFTIVNLVVVGLLRPFENRAETLKDIRLPVLIALGLALAELAGASMFKAWLVSLAAGLTKAR